MTSEPASSPRPRCPEEFVRFAHRLAKEAGAVHRRHFRGRYSVSSKADGSYVTSVDKEVEERVRSLLLASYPEHGIVGEEYGSERPDAELVWLVDPLDGTADFVIGLPLFAFLLALCREGRFVLGVLDQAILGDRWIGADGHGTCRNGEVVRTRACAALSEATVNTLGAETFCRDYAPQLAPIRAAAREVMSGGSAYAYGILASGGIDLIVSARHEAHDYAPLEPILRNAGGCMTDWAGDPLTPRSSGEVIAAGDGRLVSATTALLKRNPAQSVPLAGNN